MLVNVHDAKTNLSRLLREVERGHDVVLARNGRPVARLVPVDDDAPPPRRPPAHWAGAVQLADDFGQTPANLIDAFEGE